MNNTLYSQYEDSFFVDSYNKSMSELGLGDRCHIEFMYLTSWPLEVDHGGGGGNNNMSCTDIRNMMFYGFELSWINSLCKYGWYAKLHDNNQSKCEPSGNFLRTTSSAFSKFEYFLFFYLLINLVKRKSFLLKKK
jgi:hypothetical protein